MKFFKNVLASMLGFWLAFIIIILIGGIILAGIAMDDSVEVKNNSILELNFDGPIKDYVSTEQDAFNNVFKMDDQIGFNQILRLIQRAKNDSKIKAISIKKIPLNIGWAQTTELRDELQSFKQTGKKVWAYGDFYTQKHYYLASVADTLVLSPTGGVDLSGLHSETMFFKDFQKKYGFQMEVIRHGKYKSAVEPYIANEMSDENREQISGLIHSIWNKVKVDIEASRKFDSEEIVTNLKGRLPTLALENKLVDNLQYEDDYTDQFKTSIGENTNVVKVEDYIKTDISALNTITKNKKIAVIYAQGDIIYGEGNEDRIGQDLMIKAIDEAVENKKVKAIVLRINSPGGSALTSDLIWNAIEKAKKLKPVVVSMGNYAASGGYYIACNANKIYAEPTTITGSIGVFGVIPNANKLAKNNGINSEVVSTHDNGAHYSVINPLNEKLESAIKDGVEFIYETFVDRVAQGRNMSTAAVDSIAQGRVWTGTQALKVGLVDNLGGINDAIVEAATLAEITDYGIKEYPNYEMNLRNILGGNPLLKVWQSSESSTAKKVADKFEKLQNMFQMEGIQARIPFELAIE